MNHASVFRILAVICLAFGGIHVAPLLTALIYGEIAEAVSFAVPLIGLVLVSTLILLGFTKPTRKSLPHDGLAVVALCWIILPLVGGIPFAFATQHDIYIEAFHEAVSCLTTSGHSVLTLEEPWGVSMIVYRGVLHLFGGVLSLVTFASVIAAINLSGVGIHRTQLLTIPEDRFFDTVPQTVKVVLSVTSVVTLILFFILWIASGQIRVAFSDAISVATTGWVDPERVIPQNIIHQLTLVLGLFLSSAGLVVLLHFRDRKFKNILRDPELLTFTFLLVLFSLLAIFAGSTVWSALGWAVTTLSTSGIEITNSPVIEGNYIALWIIPALIGGSCLSTAGGIKLARVYLISRISLTVFQRGASPSTEAHLSFRNHKLSETVIIGIASYLVAYIAIATVLALGLAFSGQGYASALTGAVGSVSNSGFLVDWSSEAGLNPFSHLLLILGLILGRMEVLALIPVLSLEFWRK